MPLSHNIKVALVQISAGADKAANLAKAGRFVTEAAAQGAQLVVLPECFNSPYAVSSFAQYAEEIPSGESTTFLSNLARKSNVYLVGGSIPERVHDKIYNTSVVFDRQGSIIAKHQKLHLFDIDIPGKIRFMESDALTGGSKVTVFDTEFGRLGLGICYDLRFPEMAAVAARRGAFAMVYPGAFNTTTGPRHWHLLARGRANDNQMYVLCASPARDLSSSYHAYGHSLVVDPWANVAVEAGESEEVVYCELDPAVIADVRSSIPITTQRRFDVYADVAETATVGSK